MIDLKVSEDGKDPYVVTAVARDVLCWEKVGKNRSFGTLVENMKMTDLYDLAYLASKRLGLYEGTAAEFEKTCDVEPHAGADDDADPTQTEA